MSFERMNICNTLGLQCCRSRTANPGADSDMNAGRFSLKWTEYQFITAQYINAQPVYVFQGIVEQSDKVAGAGKRIILVDQQCT